MGSNGEDPEIVALESEFHGLSVSRPAEPEPSAEPAPEPSADSSSSSEESSWESWTEEPVQPRESIRYYAVWKIPNIRSQFDFVGIHWSHGSLAYNKIARLNNGIFEGIKFRRAPSLEEAQELFRAEASAHGVSPRKADTIYQWA